MTPVCQRRSCSAAPYPTVDRRGTGAQRGAQPSPCVRPDTGDAHEVILVDAARWTAPSRWPASCAQRHRRAPDPDRQRQRPGVRVRRSTGGHHRDDRRGRVDRPGRDPGSSTPCSTGPTSPRAPGSVRTGTASTSPAAPVGQQGAQRAWSTCCSAPSSPTCATGTTRFWRRVLPYLDLPALDLPRPATAASCGADGFEIETLINIRVAAHQLRVTEVPSIEAARLSGLSNLNRLQRRQPGAPHHPHRVPAAARAADGSTCPRRARRAAGPATHTAPRTRRVTAPSTSANHARRAPRSRPTARRVCSSAVAAGRRRHPLSLREALAATVRRGRLGPGQQPRPVEVVVVVDHNEPLLPAGQPGADRRHRAAQRLCRARGVGQPEHRGVPPRHSAGRAGWTTTHTRIRAGSPGWSRRLPTGRLRHRRARSSRHGRSPGPGWVPDEFLWAWRQPTPACPTTNPPGSTCWSRAWPCGARCSRRWTASGVGAAPRPQELVGYPAGPGTSMPAGSRRRCPQTSGRRRQRATKPASQARMRVCVVVQQRDQRSVEVNAPVFRLPRHPVLA